jgi:hypothetical protein
MSYDDDYFEYAREAAMEEFIAEQLKELAEGPAFAYLARFGDAVQERVDACRTEAEALLAAGFSGASLVRATAGIEIVVRYFLARPLVQGAFLSDEWANLLSARIFNGRTAEDRELLPAILRNWSVDITRVVLPDGPQVWQTIVSTVWPSRNAYVHKGASRSAEDAKLAFACLASLLQEVVDPIALRLGFTRSETGRWSIVLSRFDRRLNPPTTYETASPFDP